MSLDAPFPLSGLLKAVDALQQDTGLPIAVPAETYAHLRKLIVRCHSREHPLNRFLLVSVDQWKLKDRLIEILLPAEAVQQLQTIPKLREQQEAAIVDQNFQRAAEIRDEIADIRLGLPSVCGGNTTLEIGDVENALRQLGYDGPLN